MSSVLLSTRLFHFSATGRPTSGTSDSHAGGGGMRAADATLRQINKTAGLSSDRADGHRKRNQHEEQQKQRHQRNGGPATTAESRLQPSHEGPCGNHQRGRPHCRRQEGPHNKKRNDNQADNRQDGKRRARQVERFRYHRTLQRWNARSRRATERARLPNTDPGNVVFSSRSRPSAVAGRGPLFVLQRGVAIMANPLSVVRRRLEAQRVLPLPPTPRPGL